MISSANWAGSDVVDPKLYNDIIKVLQKLKYYKRILKVSLFKISSLSNHS